MVWAYPKLKENKRIIRLLKDIDKLKERDT
jgi:hypothetical protein